MVPPEPSKAKRIALAAMDFEKRRTGHSPQSVTVVLGGDTLVLTLHGALSPAERALAATRDGAAKIQEFHSELYDASAADFRREIKAITGIDVKESKAEVCSTTGNVVQVFTTGTTVQVYLLANGVPAEAWTEDGLEKPTEIKGTDPC